MSGINICVLGGNLTRDPEVKQVGSSSVTSFTIASSRKFKTKDGKERVDVDFLEVEAWDKTGEIIAKYFKKGSYITVQARAKTETWKDKTDGKNRSRIRFRVETFFFPPKSGNKEDKESSGDDNDTGGDNNNGFSGDDSPPF